MEYGITLPGTGPLATPEALAAVAMRAEAAGFTSLWATDHIALPLRATSPYPYSPDGRMPWDPTIPYLDALTVLGWVGAVTRRARLGTSILVLPMRHPLVVAKTVATLDRLSGGRMILGVGVGWLAEEFALLGQPFRDRGRRTVEAVRLLKACWSDDPVNFHGRFYDLPSFGMAPKPAQGVRLPILGGGESEAALRRAAEACDGWHPLGLTPAQLKDRVGRLTEFMARAGRSMADFLLTARTGRTISLTRDLAARYADTGVRLIVTDVDYRQTTLPAVLTRIETLARDLGLH